MTGKILSVSLLFAVQLDDMITKLRTHRHADFSIFQLYSGFRERINITRRQSVAQISALVSAVVGRMFLGHIFERSTIQYGLTNLHSLLVNSLFVVLDGQEDMTCVHISLHQLVGFFLQGFFHLIVFQILRCQLCAVACQLVFERFHGVQSGFFSGRHFQLESNEHIDVFVQRSAVGGLITVVFIPDIFEFRQGDIFSVDGHDNRILGEKMAQAEAKQ